MDIVKRVVTVKRMRGMALHPGMGMRPPAFAAPAGGEPVPGSWTGRSWPLWPAAFRHPSSDIRHLTSDGRVRGWAWASEAKGIWWMPWHREAMKDVARCEKPGGEASAR